MSDLIRIQGLETPIKLNFLHTRLILHYANIQMEYKLDETLRFTLKPELDETFTLHISINGTHHLFTCCGYVKEGLPVIRSQLEAQTQLNHCTFTEIKPIILDE